MNTEAARDRWALLLVVGVAAGVILPLLGAVGFFDPWETNYGEVAREMVVRDDYLYPFWKEAYFFSKPVLLFWLTAPLYKLVGAGDVDGPMPHSVELMGRLPSALIGIATVVVAYLVARRFWSRRASLLGALALATTPFWAFLARQAITDMPYVGFASMGILLLAPTLLLDDDEKLAARSRSLPRWFIAMCGLCLLPQLWEVARSGAFLNLLELGGSERALRVVVGVVFLFVGCGFLAFLRVRARDLGFHAACLCIALSVLAKGPIGLGLAGLIVLVVVVVAEGWRGWMGLLLHPALVSGAALFFAVASPWPLVMLYFDGLDEQRKTWFDRFIRYDLLGRVGVGVHGDRGGVEYYVKYAGLGMLPWSGMVPFAVFQAFASVVDGARERFATKEARFTLWVSVWAFVTFCFFAGTTTKFHHYILPFVVPAAMLCGRFLDRLAVCCEQAIRVVVVVVAVFSVQVFWARASQHWSQRWLNQTYEEMHKEGEPLLAFQMDWKGETFYSKNREIQVKKNANDLRTAVARPGREFVMVQTDRLDNLKSALGANSSRITVVDKSNAKWMLVLVE
jgi:4-amino-4-deoxy-L-arabinose transferase-like glycosyltransferase